jgi:hypothetical protein
MPTHTAEARRSTRRKIDAAKKIIKGSLKSETLKQFPKALGETVTSGASYPPPIGPMIMSAGVLKKAYSKLSPHQRTLIEETVKGLPKAAVTTLGAGAAPPGMPPIGVMNRLQKSIREAIRNRKLKRKSGEGEVLFDHIIQQSNLRKRLTPIHPDRKRLTPRKRLKRGRQLRRLKEQVVAAAEKK